MPTALRKDESFKAHSLADFWELANIGQYPAWAHSIKLSRTPFEHQAGDLNHLALYVRSGLYNDPGLGKTLPSQAHTLWLVSLGNRAVCVMPPVLVAQFYESFHANFPGIGAHVSIEMFSGDVSRRNQLVEGWNRSGWPQVLIMSNDMFAGKSVKEIKSLVAKRVKGALKKGTCPVATAALTDADQAGVDLWLAKGYNHLLVDEATSVKTPSSDLYKAVKKFVGPDDDNSNGLLLMTGSPIENNVTDAYGLISLITPSRYGS
jgi:SNF2 family DNA or RNA helicase